jgi:ketopantoate hydroxymethyltransferase
VQNFMRGRDDPLEALRAYVHAVKTRAYPGPEHSFS